MRSYELLGSPLFVQPLTLDSDAPRVSISHSWEVDKKNRFSPRTLVIRLWGGRGLALGFWRSTDPESLQTVAAQEQFDAEYDAYRVINGPIDYDRWLDMRAKARKTIAEHALDPDDEMALMQSIGLMK